MNTVEASRMVARALALLLLLLALNELIVSTGDLMGLVHHWRAAASSLGEAYWVRYYTLFLAGRVLSAAIMLYVANELRRGNTGLLRYLAAGSETPPRP